MADSIVQNPNNAYQGTITDYRTMKNDASAELTFLGKHTELVQANGAIAAGLAVAIVPPTGATVPPRVKKATATTFVNVGVIEGTASAAAGDVVKVVLGGVAFATAGASFTAGDLLAPDSAGKLVTCTPATATAVSAITAATTDTSAAKLVDVQLMRTEVNAAFVNLATNSRVVAVALADASGADVTAPVWVLRK